MEQSDKNMVQCIRCHKILDDSQCISFQGYVFCVKECGKKSLLESKRDLIQCSECSKFCFKSSSVSYEEYFFCSEECSGKGKKAYDSLLASGIL